MRLTTPLNSKERSALAVILGRENDDPELVTAIAHVSGAVRVAIGEAVKVFRSERDMRAAIHA